jgi:L-lysine exporter family protein LysE/ArgO
VLTSAAAGFAASAVLIIAIGAQNAFVLRQGLRREHVLAVVAICAGSDLVLISAGIAGLGALVSAHPTAVAVIRWAGAAFLITYAILAAKRALSPAALAPSDRGPATLRATVLTCLAMTWLNPHVYLDTVLLLGSVAQQHPDRWSFGVGAVTASVLWFAGLGLAARRLAPVLERPAAWRVLDGLIALVMAGLALTLAL